MGNDSLTWELGIEFVHAIMFLRWIIEKSKKLYFENNESWWRERIKGLGLANHIHHACYATQNSYEIEKNEGPRSLVSAQLYFST